MFSKNAQLLVDMIGRKYGVTPNFAETIVAVVNEVIDETTMEDMTLQTARQFYIRISNQWNNLMAIDFNLTREQVVMAVHKVMIPEYTSYLKCVVDRNTWTKYLDSNEVMFGKGINSFQK